VLARVWRGHVAPNVDLASLLESQFNGQLSEAMLAMVDEIQEGGEAGYRHINRLKSLLNAEVRAINPKYGRTVLGLYVYRPSGRLGLQPFSEEFVTLDKK
jgi:hypothetical protein